MKNEQSEQEKIVDEWFKNVDASPERETLLRTKLKRSKFFCNVYGLLLLLLVGVVTYQIPMLGISYIVVVIISTIESNSKSKLKAALDEINLIRITQQADNVTILSMTDEDFDDLG